MKKKIADGLLGKFRITTKGLDKPDLFFCCYLLFGYSTLIYFGAAVT
jgi:hypothetical protein